MTTTSANSPRVATPKYSNGAEWLHALGNVPLERVVMTPAPGTATEDDLLTFVERDKRPERLADVLGFDAHDDASAGGVDGATFHST